jgi:uncharacterized protein
MGGWIYVHPLFAYLVVPESLIRYSIAARIAVPQKVKGGPEGYDGMKEQLQALYKLQQIDVRIASFRKALAALDNGETLKGQLVGVEKRHAELSETLRKVEADLRDCELELKSLEEKKKGFEAKLYDGKTTNPKELSGIEKEIAMLGKTREKLDERTLTLYESVEKQKTETDKIGALIASAKERLVQIVSKYKTEAGRLNDEIAKLTEIRQKAIDGITDKILLQKYETVRVRYKDTGLALVKEGKCGGCHISLTPYVLRMIKEDGEIQICESCGRILYDEDQGT